MKTWDPSALSGLIIGPLTLKQFLVILLLVGSLTTAIIFLNNPPESIEESEEERPGGLYVDDLNIARDGKTIFSDEFNRVDCEGKGWERTTGAEIQQTYSHSPPKALVMRQRGQYVSHAFRDVEIRIDWRTVNYSGYVMVPEYFPVEDARKAWPDRDYNDTSTDFVLYSGSSYSSIGGGVYVSYYSNNHTFKTYVGLHINYQANADDIMESEHIENKAATLTPYLWYRFSMVLDSVSEQAQLYLNDRRVATLPLDFQLFEKFDRISIWGWIP